MGLLPDPAPLIAADKRAFLVVGRGDLITVFGEEFIKALRERRGEAVEVVSVGLSGKGPRELRGLLPPSLFPSPRCLRVTGAAVLKGKDPKAKGSAAEEAPASGEGRELSADAMMTAETIAALGPDDFLLLLAEFPEDVPVYKYKHPFEAAGIPGLTVLPHLRTPDEGALVGWLAERCRQGGVEAEKGLLRRLVENAGGDLLVLKGEVEKLSLAFSGRKASLAEAEPLLTEIPSDNVFALTDALIAGRRDRILRILSDLAISGEEPIGLVAIVAAQVRTLLTIRHALDSGTSAAEISRSLRQPPHVRKALLDAAARLPYATLVAAFSRLVAADRAMKSSSHPPATILETALLTLFTPPPMGYSYLATLEQGEVS